MLFRSFTGVENAPLTWLFGRLFLAGLSNCTWRMGDLWTTTLGEYDLVYAFLSPTPMPALWEKVRAEMRPGALFVSNSFEVPGLAPSRVIEVGDRRGTKLYCYEVPAR